MQKNTRVLGVVIGGALAIGPVARAEVVAAQSAPSFEIAQGRGQATLLLNDKTGSPEAALSRLSLQPGAAVPEHVHEGSAEFLYVMSGEMTLVLDGQKQVLRAGDAVHIPAGHKHAGQAAASGPRVELVQIYVGPGPEARFRTGKPITLPSKP